MLETRYAMLQISKIVSKVVFVCVWGPAPIVYPFFAPSITS
jgi:hypothetical protein